jgi:hypothetical protein
MTADEPTVDQPTMVTAMLVRVLDIRMDDNGALQYLVDGEPEPDLSSRCTQRSLSVPHHKSDRAGRLTGGGASCRTWVRCGPPWTTCRAFATALFLPEGDATSRSRGMRASSSGSHPVWIDVAPDLPGVRNARMTHPLEWRRTAPVAVRRAPNAALDQSWPGQHHEDDAG